MSQETIPYSKETLSNLQLVQIPVIRATKENTKHLGQWIGSEISNVKDIPFYKGNVIEGDNFDFQYHEKACIRTARLLPRSEYPVNWIERHSRLTQLFIGLGTEPFCLILAPPTDKMEPNVEDIGCYLFPAGSGIIIHLGVWHDFPLPLVNPVTVLTMNSVEVVDALQKMTKPDEMNQGDVFKLYIPKHFGIKMEIKGMPMVVEK